MNKLLIFFLNLLFAGAQRTPDSVTSVEISQMTSKVLYLKWKKPETNYTLTHYDIQYTEINKDYVDGELYLKTVDKDSTHTRLPELKTNKKYKIYIYSIYKEIFSNPTTIDVNLKSLGKYSPMKPDFNYSLKKGGKEIDITWLPNIKSPGDQFFVSYKMKKDSTFVNSKIEAKNLNIVIAKLKNNETYQFYVVARYDMQMSMSETKEIHIGI